MRRALLGGALLLVAGCYPFEFPQHFVEIAALPDAGLPDGQQPDETFSSCPTLTAPVPGDGGVVPAFDTLTVDLPTSIGLVGFPSAIPVGCAEPLSAVASRGLTAVTPQPRFTFALADAGVVAIDDQGLVTGLAVGVASVTVDAGVPFVKARQIWVGGDATLSLTPGPTYSGLTTALHATATAGTITGPSTNANITAHFSMRQGTGLDAVERSLVLQMVGADLEPGQTPLTSITYREFGEHLPGRVRDFVTMRDVTFESLNGRTVRFSFTGLELSGVNGTVKLTGHLEFTAP
jgi:hypothetical protein